MALSILDGNQTATTLSTILSSGQHITAHTVVSLGTQAITDMRGAVSGSVVSISNLPSTQTIAGTVTVGVLPDLTTSTDFEQAGTQIAAGITNYGSIPVYIVSDFPLPAGTNQIGSVTASGTVTANIGGIASSVTLPVRLNAEKFGEAPSGQDTLVVCNSSGMLLVDANSGGSSVLGFDGNAFVKVKPVSGSSVTVGNTVTVSISGTPSVTFGLISGTVTANLDVDQIDQLNFLAFARINDENGNPVNNGNPLPISGTVTANSSNGSLTTQFGSVVTANTAFATSAVTNANRKYLLIQNITTASNVITVGIGFTPTTTQGIQLFAGAGLTFEGTYIPTGAVNLLSSVTASCYTILEA